MPAADAPAGRPGAGSAQLVGRSRELSLLRGEWRAAAAGRPSMVLVRVAPASGRAASWPRLPRWLQGAIVASTQCFATSGRLALAPVADWLRNPAVRSAASAGGFPLYVIEAVRSSDDLSAGMPVGDLTTVLRNRLGQVSAAAREVAGLAAAVGTDFTLDLLTEASDLDADTVVGAIDELWRRRRRSTPGPATPHPSCSRPLSARSSWRNHWAARTRRSPAWSRSGHRSSCKGEPPTATRPRPGR